MVLGHGLKHKQSTFMAKELQKYLRTWYRALDMKMTNMEYCIRLDFFYVMLSTKYMSIYNMNKTFKLILIAIALRIVSNRQLATCMGAKSAGAAQDAWQWPP